MRIVTKDILGYDKDKRIRLYNTDEKKMEYIKISRLKEKLEENENYCNLKYERNTDSLKILPIDIKGNYIKLTRSHWIYIGGNIILCWLKGQILYVNAKIDDVLYIDTTNGLEIRLENYKEVHIGANYIWNITKDSLDWDINIDNYEELKFFRTFSLENFLANNIKLELLATSIIN